MNKWYFGLPLALLLVFGGYYWHYKTAYDAAKAEKARMVDIAAQEKKKADHLAQVAAIEENNRVTAIREKERADQKAREEAEKAAREADAAKATALADDLRRLMNSITSLQKDIEVEESLKNRATSEITALQAEQAFLDKYVKLAQSNSARMLALVDKVDDAAKKVKDQIDAAMAAANPKKG